jgi:hypothetical protein
MKVKDEEIRTMLRENRLELTPMVFSVDGMVGAPAKLLWHANESREYYQDKNGQLPTAKSVSSYFVLIKWHHHPNLHSHTSFPLSPVLTMATKWSN